LQQEALEQLPALYLQPAVSPRHLPAVLVRLCGLLVLPRLVSDVRPLSEFDEELVALQQKAVALLHV